MFAAFLSIAAMAFGPAPCGDIHIEVQRFSDGAVGKATIGGVANTTPGQEVPACTILISPEALERGRAFACTVVVHEDGHITGHQHSADPRSVMYPYVERLYWRCRHRWPPHRPRFTRPERSVVPHPDGEVIRTVPIWPIREPASA